MTKQVRDDEALRRIGARFRELREATGKHQRDVYAETGIHIAAIEVGRFNISVTTLERLCDYYGVTFVEFFEGLGL